ncbi:MAG TPA: F0F1 ATP synthase subunit A [Candidatus Saccharimonadales bacterium]|jgi:F-type H+-transporting ATPase subunit a|nr:F0F1 ATP synthase subunit A [Candidatus Saccharimonadales bacterium]
MPEQLWLTEFLNHYFGAVTTALLQHLGIQPEYPAVPISNAFAMELVVVFLLLVFFLAVRSRLSAENPGPLQHTVEMVEEFVAQQAKEVVGPHSERYLPYAISLGLFILLCNLLGLVPGFESPTASPTVPLGCALTTFLYYHFHGIRVHRWNYYKQFIGPVWPLAPLMFLIEVISHFARLLSLTVRLYANMFAGDLITMAFFSLVPVVVPVMFLGMHLGVALMQTYIFVMLTLVYLGMAVSEEH